MHSDSAVYVAWYVADEVCDVTGLTNLALFIVPYIQLVFGVECALRSLRRFPFQARGKYDVTICCGVVVLMLIGTWLPSHLIPQPDVCFASLVWFITRYGQLGLKLLSVTVALMTLSAIIIFVRLSTVNLIDEHQRIAASRMVYYLVLGIVSLVSYSWPSDVHKLINLGIRYSILCIFDQRAGRHQALHDGDSCVKFVGVDEWFITAVPQIEHCSNLIWFQAGTAMGS
jgi:hypothetical protein